VSTTLSCSSTLPTESSKRDQELSVLLPRLEELVCPRTSQVLAATGRAHTRKTRAAISQAQDDQFQRDLSGPCQDRLTRRSEQSTKLRQVIITEYLHARFSTSIPTSLPKTRTI